MRRALQRGQAAVELAIGSTVFVTVLLFGIHFAEMGWAAAKMHEATASSLWDSTAYRAYQFGDWYDSAQIAVPAANAKAQRYTDWDGRTSTVRTGSPRLALTTASAMEISCVKSTARAYALPPYAPRFGESGGVGCTVQADVFPLRIPSAFVEGGNGMFKAANLQRASYKLCGTGSLTAGTCGSLSLLVGDDALNHDRGDQLECGLTTSSPTPCLNTGFYSVARDTWNQSMFLAAGWADGWTGRPEEWARDIVPGVPRGRVTGFYLSFRGEESGFNENVRNGGAWNTSPMDAVLASGMANYRLAYTPRRQCVDDFGGYCWLGKVACD